MRNRYTEEDHLSFPELSTPFSRSDAQHFLSLYKNNKTRNQNKKSRSFSLRHSSFSSYYSCIGAYNAYKRMEDKKKKKDRKHNKSTDRNRPPGSKFPWRGQISRLHAQ